MYAAALWWHDACLVRLNPVELSRFLDWRGIMPGRWCGLLFLAFLLSASPLCYGGELAGKLETVFGPSRMSATPR